MKKSVLPMMVAAGFEPAQTYSTNYAGPKSPSFDHSDMTTYRAPHCLQEDSNRRILGNAHSPDPVPAGM